MALGIYCRLLTSREKRGKIMTGPEIIDGALRQDFGPKQVRERKDLKKGSKYVAVYSVAGAKEEFEIAEGPYKVNGKWSVRVKINVGEAIFYKIFYLHQFNVVPDENGGWNQCNYIERTK